MAKYNRLVNLWLQWITCEKVELLNFCKILIGTLKATSIYSFNSKKYRILNDTCTESADVIMFGSQKRRLFVVKKSIYFETKQMIPNKNKWVWCFTNAVPWPSSSFEWRLLWFLFSTPKWTLCRFRDWAYKEEFGRVVVMFMLIYVISELSDAKFSMANIISSAFHSIPIELQMQSW